MSKTIDELCEIAHETFEIAAEAHGLSTKVRPRTPWEDLPEENKDTMRAMMLVVSDVILTDFRKDLGDWR